jgi:hypothetical protein
VDEIAPLYRYVYDLDALRALVAIRPRLALQHERRRHREAVFALGP